MSSVEDAAAAPTRARGGRRRRRRCRLVRGRAVRMRARGGTWAARCRFVYGSQSARGPARRHHAPAVMERPCAPCAAAAPDMRAPRRRARPRERWLLTRKTWRYMSDAGRRLVPDSNRAEDLPRLEAYFQEVCTREPRFLLWRKSSYPGALPVRPRRPKRPRGGSVRARSPPPAPLPTRPADLAIPHTSGGRFDIAKLRRDFFTSPPPAAPPRAPPPEDEDGDSLVDLLRRHLRVEDDGRAGDANSAEELVRALRGFLRAPSAVRPSDGDTEPARRALADHLARHGRLAHSERAVRDLLADKNALKKLYTDLRKPKPYRGARSGGSGGGSGGNGGFSSGGYAAPTGAPRPVTLRHVVLPSRVPEGERRMRSPPRSPPPLIEVQELPEERYASLGTQTVPIPEEVLVALERAYRERLEASTAPTSPTSPPGERRGGPGAGRRRSSVDHDDVRQSVTDHVMRYFRMARKKSVDTDKDRFKRINYDKNLRNIKPRTPGDFDDDEFNKGCQTVDDWVLTYRELQFASVASTPTSPSTSFLSTLLGRGVSAVAVAGGMQKSRSSSSVVQSVSKRLWRTRSRSSSRAAAAWTPQGSCLWCDGSGRCVRLTDTSLLTLSEVERRALQQAALARLQQILGTTIKIPDETAVSSTKPKRRAYLLKRKALTTGFFDQSRTKDDKDKDSTSGSVFGVPLAQCVATERALRRQQHGGSRASLASLGAMEKADDSGSCDSGEWGWAGLEEAGGGGPRVPGLVSACLAHLRRHGLHTLGLFRVSASKKRVRQLREDWERSQELALDSAACPHDVATLLKEFLRDLPDPLLCRDLFPAFLHTQKLHNRHYQWEALRLIVQLLPAAHRDTLNALLSFLSQLAAHAEDSHQPGNKMDAANLATVFAPNILHKNKPNEAANAEQLLERADVINVVRQLVERQAELWTLPAELLHEAYIQLSHSAPASLDPLLLRKAEIAAEQANASSGDGLRRVWSRESCLHGAAATGGPRHVQPASDKSYSRSRRTRDTASDTSSGSLSSAMTIVTRVRSSEECGSSGVVCSTPAPRTDSTADSNDSASDYNETLGGSDDDCVITASLHIPAAFAPPSPRAPAAPPRRRSTSGSDGSKRDSTSDGSKRDSAVGSSSSSPPGSPPPAPAPAPLRVTVTAGEVRRSDDRRNTDIDRLVGLGRERNTSDARAVVLRQHDDTTTTVRTRVSTRTEHTHRKEDSRKEDARKEDSRKDEKKEERREGTLYKRGELISSARSPPT